MNYSNITKEELDKLLKEWYKKHKIESEEVLKRNVYNPICQYALDTGEKAFSSMPCRGNRIICQHPENKDFTSYTKACNPGMCKFFKQKECGEKD